MEKFTATQLEQFLELDTEIICSMEHRERIEADNGRDPGAATTVTTSVTTGLIR